MADFKQVEILLVEDNPTDAELTIRALKRHHLANKLVWVKDGAEALGLQSATRPRKSGGNGYTCYSTLATARSDTWADLQTSVADWRHTVQDSDPPYMFRSESEIWQNMAYARLC